MIGAVIIFLLKLSLHLDTLTTNFVYVIYSRIWNEALKVTSSPADKIWHP